MATSQNGGLVVENNDPRLIFTVIPGTNGVLYLGGIMGADLNTIAMYWGYRWHTEVEPILPPAVITGQWGHNKRDIRGSTTEWSNHAAGEAWDTNAARHPLGTRTLSGAQLNTLRRMTNDLQGVIRSGAFYSGRPDEMHAERIGSYVTVSHVAGLIRANALPNVPRELVSGIPEKPSTPTTPTKPVAKDWFSMATQADLIAAMKAVLQGEGYSALTNTETVEARYEPWLRKVIEQELAKILGLEGSTGVNFETVLNKVLDARHLGN